MLADAALGIVNHLLTSEGWARDRLKVFAGRKVRLEQGVLKLTLAITPTGLLDSSGEQGPVDVSIALPADAPFRVLIDGPSLFASAQINGSAELAETLGFVFRNMHWDVESDLSPLVGDIAAHRLVEGSKAVVKWHQKRAENLALNLAEYFTEENPRISRRRDISNFCSEVESLRKALELIEQRVAAMEMPRP